LIADGTPAAGLAIVVTVGTNFASQHQPARRPFDARTIALVIGAAGPLALRRRHPVAVLAAVFGMLTAMCGHGASIGSDTNQHRPARPSTDANGAPAEAASNGIERHRATRTSSY